MTQNKGDRRVRYTKMVIRESFISLLEEKNIGNITITGICKKADINRTTFYSHYNDQYDLMNEIQNDLFDNVGKRLSTYLVNDIEFVPVDMVKEIFEYIKENARICKLLLGEKGDYHFQKRVFMLVYDKLIHDITKDGQVSKDDAEYIYAFTLSGCVGAIQKWLNDDMTISPKRMAEIIIDLTIADSVVQKNKFNPLNFKRFIK